MTTTKKNTGLLGRLWRMTKEASEIFVALRYSAPWERPARATCNR